MKCAECHCDHNLWEECPRPDYRAAMEFLLRRIHQLDHRGVTPQEDCGRCYALREKALFAAGRTGYGT